jgi:pilus assembly protein CpaB
MKWAMIVLVLLGILAAICASILVNTLRTQESGRGNRASDRQVVLAAESLPAMSVVNAVHVSQNATPKKKLPAGYLTDPVQAIGGVLAVPVVKGQILTWSCFVSEGTGAQLAAALPHGMRAISVPIASHSVTGGLLYPGCIVDVLAAFRLRYVGRNKGQAISTTLLHEIQVLAVEGTSVVSESAKRQKDPAELNGPKNKNLTVTLMVNPRQAEALQLAAEHGRISLAMRNPLDKSPVDINATVLSEGKLAKLGAVLAPAVLDGKAKEDLSAHEQRDTGDSNKQTGADKLAEKLSWSVEVIRGREVREQELDLRQAKVEALAHADN